MNTLEIGGWNFIPELLNKNSIVYSFGVGKNIDFDLGVIDKVGCVVHAFDPTPGIQGWLDNSKLPDKFIFYPWGIFDHDGIFHFRGNQCGNWSLFGKAAGGIFAPFFRLQTIMLGLEHSKIDLLKIDIEGAEYRVIKSFIESKIYPKQFLVEFHFQVDEETIRRSLAESGYTVFETCGGHISFVREDK